MIPEASIQSYQRALSVGLAISLLGELFYWVVWGLILFPGHPWETLRWSLACGLGMGAVIGTLTCLWIIDRWQGLKAAIASFCIAFGVFMACSVNCYLMDQSWDYWGTVTHPRLFLIAGGVGAIQRH